MADPIIPMPPILEDCNAPAQQFGMAYLAAFPSGSSIVSGRRNIDEQAQDDAADVVQSRSFIASTYAPSKVRDAMVAVCDANPTADAATLAPLFAACLGQFNDAELAEFSAHLSGNALDLAPVGDPEREAWARQWIADWIARGGNASYSRVLTREGGLPRLHGQLT